MPEIPDESVQLVVTSPPYANLKAYEPGNLDQLGDIEDYDKFLDELDKVWGECARVLVPGGRVCCVVGDVNVARTKGGRHHVLPLAADIRVRARRLGLDHLQGIVWYKVANIKMEASRSSRYLGKPNLPGGIIKNDTEHILFLRKRGYRSPSAEMEERSFIPTKQYISWFRSIWSDIPGASTKRLAQMPLFDEAIVSFDERH
jgi:DNA modification methylase